MDSLLSSSILSNRLIEDNYKLALKLFVNKNVQKSWIIISGLYQQAINEYEKGLIGDKLFVKIISLYLIEIGYNLQDNTDKVLVSSLRNKTLINHLSQVFSGMYNIPEEILYNYYLVYVTNRELLVEGNRQFYEDIDQLYLNYKSSDDKYYLKLVDLYVYEILPINNRFDQSRSVIDNNQIYSDKADAKSKLDEVERRKSDDEKKQQQIKLEKQQKDQEAQLKKDQHAKLQREKQLEYVKLNELSNSRDLSRPAPDQPTMSQLQLLKSRITYLLSISTNYIKQSSPLLLAIIVTILITSRFVNYRKLNLRDKLKQTVEMAFKVSYL